jgi:transcriptional regulator with XRE-family HTH domain
MDAASLSRRPVIAEQLRVTIQETMWERGVQQAELARRAGMSEAAVSRFVRGSRGLSFEAIDRVLGVLGLEVVIRPRRDRKDG